MSFKNLFSNPAEAARHAMHGAGDYRSTADYIFSSEMELAISAAAATQRPLFVTGPAGCGKSSLARAVAKKLQWRYIYRTINSRTEIHSLLWEIDHLKRLQDSHLGKLDEDILAYVKSAIVWEALDPETANDPKKLKKLKKSNLEADKPALNPAVVLIDEIDKADPDLPNNLLEVLGSLSFEVADSGLRVSCRAGIPLILITSNDERDLPPAFVRRCITLRLKQPDLKAVGKRHFPTDDALVDEALSLLNNESMQVPSAAEFLDFVQACRELQVVGQQDWLSLAKACVSKGRG